MTDPISAMDPSRARTEQDPPWARRLLIFLRVVAGLMMLKGVVHWIAVLGVGDGDGSTFEASPLPWQAATMFFAVMDLVAAVGLWLAAAWGGVVWLTAAISMMAVELFFPQIYGGRLWVVFGEMIVITGYIGLAMMAGRERPE